MKTIPSRELLAATLVAALVGALGLGVAGCPPKPTPGPETAAPPRAGDTGPGKTEVEVEGPGGSPKLVPAREKESPPPPGPVKDAKFPPLVTTKLKNGLEVVTVESHELPVVSLALVIRSGAAMDPPGMEGLADFTGEIMRRGTKTHTAEGLAEAIEFVGGTLFVSTDQDSTTIGVQVLSEHLPTALTLLRGIILEPIFPDDEIAKYRDKSIADLKDMLSQPSFLAGRTLARALYGAHPYGTISPTEASLKKIDRKSLVAFWTKHYAAANAFVVVAGDVTSPAITKDLGDYLGKWKKGAASKAVKPPAPAPKERKIYLVDRPGSAQTEIYLGNPAIRRTDPSYFALYLANQVLGGSSSARLFKELRGKKGYTYGTYSSLRAFAAGGHWRGEVRGVDVPKSIPALRDFVGLVGALPSEPIGEDLANAKSYLTGVFATSIETIGQVAAKVVDMKVYGLPKDYWDTYNSKLAAVTEAEALEAAKKFVLPDTGILVIVGDANAKVPEEEKGPAVKTLKEALRAFGTVELLDKEGKAIETLEAVKAP